MIFYKKISSLQKRNFDVQLLKSKAAHQEFIKNGFVHFSNIIPKETITQLIDVFNEIKQDTEYEDTNYYVNSVSFKSNKIKKYTREKVKELVTPHLKKFLKEAEVRFPISVGYCINPKNSVSGSRPHQDPTLVDETKSYSIVLWLSLCDTNEQNGCLKVLKGSHLWGNHIRSNFHVDWHFDAYVEDILNDNIANIPTKAGDIICFDPALIHGSDRNKTDIDRLAIQISAIPIQHQLISVVEEKGMFMTNAKYYQINEDYFTDESVWHQPSKKYPVVKTEKINYCYTKSGILKLINESTQ